MVLHLALEDAMKRAGMVFYDEPRYIDLIKLEKVLGDNESKDKDNRWLGDD